MRINNINTTNFNGYKNIMSHRIGENDKNSFTIMAMQLDNKEFADLDKWKSIQRDLLKRTNLSDTILFKTLTIDNEPLFFLENIFLAPNENNKLESGMLKAIDLISSLTYRIKSEYFPPENQNIHLSLCKIMADLKEFIKHSETEEEICKAAACKEIPHYKTAEHINSLIQKKMTRYFKL